MDFFQNLNFGFQPIGLQYRIMYAVLNKFKKIRVVYLKKVMLVAGALITEFWIDLLVAIVTYELCWPLN